MPTSEVAFRIFLVLLPGFAAAYAVQTLTVRAKQTDLEKVIEAFLFSFVIYVTYYLFHPKQSPVFAWRAATDSAALFKPLSLISLLFITCLYAAALILFVNKDGTTFLRKLGITERTSRSSIWNDVFQNSHDNPIVQVELADGRSLQGYVGFYSDTAEESSIFLTNARWVGEEGHVVELPGPGILLTKEAKIISITFLDPLQDEAEQS